MKSMTKTAYCKINLTLEILGTRRGDGFHDLKSVMHKIPLGDIITLQLKEGQGRIFINCSQNVCKDEDNLAYRAAVQYLQSYQKSKNADFDVYIDVEKVTPTGAGLGGGSADAACVLDMLYKMAGGVDFYDVEKIAACLGSDVVFCLDRYKCAYCTGKGEICTSIATLPKSTCIVVAKPTQSLNTKGIYKSYDELYGDNYQKNRSEQMKEALEWANVKNIAECFVNDFEEICIARLGQIGVLKETIKENGAYLSGMSGSGSAVFGLFDEEEKCFECKKKLESMGITDVFAFTAQDFEKMYCCE